MAGLMIATREDAEEHYPEIDFDDYPEFEWDDEEELRMSETPNFYLANGGQRHWCPISGWVTKGLELAASELVGRFLGGCFRECGALDARWHDTSSPSTCATPKRIPDPTGHCLWVGERSLSPGRAGADPLLTPVTVSAFPSGTREQPSAREAVTASMTGHTGRSPSRTQQVDVGR